MDRPTARLRDAKPKPSPPARESNRPFPSTFGLSVVGGRFSAHPEQIGSLVSQIFGPTEPWSVVGDEIFVEHGQIAAEGGGASYSFACVRMVVSHASRRELRTVVTHCFVDDGWALIHGRQLFGLPALLAVFEATSSNETTISIVGDAYVATPFLTIAHERGRARASKAAFITAQRAMSAEGRLPFVQVKQMRDGLDPARACFQLVVTGEATLSTDGSTLEPVHVELHFHEPERAAAPPPGSKPIPTRPFLSAHDWGLESVASSDVGYRLDRATLDFVLAPPEAHTEVVRSGRAGPRFRARRGDPQAAPAYEFTDVEIVGFRLPVALEFLERVCDEQLNQPLAGRRSRFRPANVDLVIECLDYPRMTSESPPLGVDPRMSTSQRELTFRMLVGREGPNGHRIDTPAVFCPFVFVDSPWSLISGREVMGYPKQFASFKSLGDRGQFDACEIEFRREGAASSQPLMYADCRFERSPRSVVQALAEGERARSRSRPEPRPRPPIDFAWWGLADLQSGGTDSESFIAPWLAGQSIGYRGLQVKSFGDAAMPGRARYLELVECDYTLLKAEVTLPTHDATLAFPERAGLNPLAQAFGLPPIVPVPPGCWYRTKASFRVRALDPLA